MFSKPLSTTVIVLITVAFFSGCNLGRVSQGRVVEYDKARGVMTVVLEAENPKPGEPKYALPVREVRIPANVREMGPIPETGRLLILSARNRQITIYDPVSRKLRNLNYTPLSESKGVTEHDLRIVNRKLPAIDREKKTVTLYSPPEQMLVTLALADPDLALPDDTWRFGDEVRYYYKQPGQALRLMNVTKTSLAKGGKGH